MQTGHSRIPVYEGDLDHVLGLVHLRDLTGALRANRGAEPVALLVRPIHVVPETKKIDELLHEFQNEQIQMALVVDEYGGTEGLVTIEDLLEEIVGEIRDEYDVEEERIQVISDHEAILDGRVSIHDANEVLPLGLDDDDYDTVAGLVVWPPGEDPFPWRHRHDWARHHPGPLHQGPPHPPHPRGRQPRRRPHSPLTRQTARRARASLRARRRFGTYTRSARTAWCVPTSIADEVLCTVQRERATVHRTQEIDHLRRQYDRRRRGWRSSLVAGLTPRAFWESTVVASLAPADAAASDRQWRHLLVVLQLAVIALGTLLLVSVTLQPH